MLKNLQIEIKSKKLTSIKGSKEITYRKIYNNINVNHLVTLEEFKKFLDEGNILLKKYANKNKKIEIDASIYLMKKRLSTYIPPNSNKQFQKIYNSNILNQNRLEEMLFYFLDNINIKKILLMIKNNETDSTIINAIINNIFIKKDYYTKIYRIHIITNIIMQYLPNKNKEKSKLLDIGIGSGYKTKMIRDFLNVDIFGADIEQWGPYKIKEKNFDFTVKTIQLKPYHIPYPSKSFDCITLILTLHHTKYPLEVINECKRLLTDNGIIVLIEHDVWSDELNMIIDLQHIIFSKLNKENDKYFGQYYNFYEWDILFYKSGFNPIYRDRIIDNPSFKLRYDSQYIAIYKKI